MLRGRDYQMQENRDTTTKQPFHAALNHQGKLLVEFLFSNYPNPVNFHLIEAGVCQDILHNPVIQSGKELLHNLVYFHQYPV